MAAARPPASGALTPASTTPGTYGPASRAAASPSIAMTRPASTTVRGRSRNVRAIATPVIAAPAVTASGSQDRRPDDPGSSARKLVIAPATGATTSPVTAPMTGKQSGPPTSRSAEATAATP